MPLALFREFLGKSLRSIEVDMIYLFTGSPGASKTLNAIKFISEKFADRVVYAYNVRELSTGWNVIDSQQASNWFDLPDGCVILLDECQELFPPRRNGSDVPAIVSNLNTHRHKGIDIVLVTQHPSLIDVAVRRVVNEHTHLVRPFGANYAKSYVWTECVNDPSGSTEMGRAIESRVPFDKKYFSAYKSAEFHTAKRRIPKPVFVLVGAFLVCAVFAFFFVMRYEHKKELLSNASAETATTLKPADPVPSQNDQSVDKDWNDQQKPRVAGFPWTAPKYDDLRKPVTWPKPQCIVFRKQCRCYTQQATLMPDVPASFCLSAVKYGYFDDTKPDAVVTSDVPSHESAPQERAGNAGPPGRAVLLTNSATRRPAQSQPEFVPNMAAPKGQRFQDAMYFN